MEKVLAAALAVVVMLIIPSCVAEKPEDCLDVRLLIKTDQDSGRWAGSTRSRTRTSDIEEWYNSIESIDLYVFDENEKFVTLWEGGPYTPGMDYEVPLKEIGLSEGVYTFVAWTDPGTYYVSNLEDLMNVMETEEGETATRQAEPEPEPEFYLQDMRMFMNMDKLVDNGSNAIEENLPHRHYGILQRAYVSNNSILYPKPATLEISPSIHKVNFTVVGITTQTLDDRDDFTLSVTDKNSAHTFHNAYDPDLGQPYKHIRPLNVVSEPGETRAVDENTRLTASMHLMQLNDDTMTRIEIHDARFPDEPVHVEENLVDLIRTVYSTGGQVVNDEFFKEILEFDVTIDLRTYPKIILNINGWQYIYIADRIKPVN